MPLATDRLALPLLAAAQAQKETTHNEALVLLDAAVQPVVLAVAPTGIPSSPSPGQSWIVGADPDGGWAGYSGALATWTAGGWRFLAPFEGMEVWSIADSATVRREGPGWITGVLKGHQLLLGREQVVGPRQSAVAVPAGGSTVDAEARAAIAEILDRMRAHGLITE